MTILELSLLASLLIFHFLADFAFQKTSWIDERYEKHHASPLLYLHVGLHTVMALVALLVFLAPSWALVGYALLIGATHFLADLAKSYTARDQARWLVLDQMLHILVIVLVWLAVSDQWNLVDDLSRTFLREDVLIVLLAYIIVIWPFSLVVGLICDTWTKDIDSQESLKNAGRLIGQLERFLILTFILVGQFTAIGFLLAAKSLLRFGDAKEPDHRKINEYILVGTLASFSATIALGLAIVNVIGPSG